jgi:hypothetical protein
MTIGAKSEFIFDSDSFKASLHLANYIVKSYSKFISENSRGEHIVFDEKVLPHPKKTIQAAYKLWLLYLAKHEESIEKCRVQFPLLAQFQKDIGGKPKQLFVESMKSSNEPENDKTSLFDKNSSPLLIADMALVKKIFEERVNIEKFIQSHLKE